MRNVIRIIYIFTLFSGASYADDRQWYNAESLRCYESENEFLRQEYGDGFQNDENIVIKKINLKNNVESQFFWALDITPSINVTRNLLVKKKNDEVCHLLTIPTMSTNDFKLGPKGELPNKIIASDTPSFGFDQKIIVFELNKKTDKYSPITCRTISKSKNKTVNCAELF